VKEKKRGPLGDERGKGGKRRGQEPDPPLILLEREGERKDYGREGLKPGNLRKREKENCRDLFKTKKKKKKRQEVPIREKEGRGARRHAPKGTGKGGKKVDRHK